MTQIIEFLSCGVYLGIYFSLKNKYKIEDELKLMFLGGISGCCSFSSIFWLDPIKTKLLANDYGSKNSISLIDEVKKNIMLKQKCGVAPALMNQFFSNSIAFLFYEMTIKHFEANAK